jgi:uncharacterized protein YbaA (DUF1428 family)
MTYFDFYMAPVPKENKNDYEEIARISAEIIKEYGALRVVECWLDDSGPDSSTYHGETVRQTNEAYRNFAAVAGASTEETVVISFIEWENKAARDDGMKKITSDPRMQFTDIKPAFDGSRLVAAGFLPMLSEYSNT